jgi:ABC-2 type transport system permease protein
VSTAATQALVLARRAVLRTARQPALVFFPLVFPVILLAVNSGGLKAETRLPGFPTNSFFAFALAVPFVQGALLATVNANVEFARDIQSGFLNRLALTPVRSLVLLVGQLGGLLSIAVIQAIFYLGIGLAFGVRLKSGIGGGILLLLLEALIALAFASMGSWAALRTGSTDAVQSLFPVFFVFLFISSMNIPRNLIEANWFRWAATLNPVSYLIEAVRSLVITGWDGRALALGFGISLVGGLTLGALMGRYRPVEQALDIYVNAMLLAPPMIFAPISTCLIITARSSGVSRPGLSRMTSLTPILPMSCSGAASRSTST